VTGRRDLRWRSRAASGYDGDGETLGPADDDGATEPDGAIEPDGATEPDGAADPEGAAEPDAPADGDGETSTDGDGSSVGDGIGRKVPPLPSNRPLSRIKAKTASVTITKIDEARSRIRIAGSGTDAAIGG